MGTGRTPGRFARTTATAAVLATLLISTTAHAAPAAALGETITLPVRHALGQMPIVAEDRTGYERAAFKRWVDVDRDGCSTRAEVF